MLELLECNADIAGLGELIDAGLGRGLFHYDLELDAIDLSCSGSDIHLLCCQGPLHHGRRV